MRKAINKLGAELLRLKKIKDNKKLSQEERVNAALEMKIISNAITELKSPKAIEL